MAKMRFAVLLLAATSAAFVADGSASRPYQGDEAPIGVFDSGLGGLTVLERLLDVDQVTSATRPTCRTATIRRRARATTCAS